MALDFAKETNKGSIGCYENGSAESIQYHIDELKERGNTQHYI